MIPDQIKLSHLEPLGGGTHRLIFDAPGAPGILVKVMREKPAKPPEGFLRRLKYHHKARSTSAQFRFLFREHNAYIKAKLSAQRKQSSLPVSELRGLVVTDLGLGMLVDKIVDETGALAPRLRDFAMKNCMREYLPLLNEFARQFFELNILANDINANNIVFGIRNGKKQFILIDGLGDPTVFGIRSLSRAANYRCLHKRMHKTADGCGLRWNPQKVCFELDD